MPRKIRHGNSDNLEEAASEAYKHAPPSMGALLSVRERANPISHDNSNVIDANAACGTTP